MAEKFNFSGLSDDEEIQVPPNYFLQINSFKRRKNYKQKKFTEAKSLNILTIFNCQVRIVPVKCKSLKSLIENKFSLGDGDCEIYCCKYDYDDKYVACAQSNGKMIIYNVQTGLPAFKIEAKKTNPCPFTCLRWRPNVSLMKSVNVITSVNAEGYIEHWHMNSGKLLNKMRDQDMYEPQLLSIDYNWDCSKFVVSGTEPVLTIYDENKKCISSKLTGENTIIPGHASRVFCAKFDKQDPNVILSGGWDCRVIIWDVRGGKPETSLFGPVICGDGIDTSENAILTCGYQKYDQLQVWDLKTCKVKKSYNFQKYTPEPVQFYAGMFGKGPLEEDFILAGGGITGECFISKAINGAKIMQYDDEMELLYSIEDIPSQIDSLDFTSKGDQFCLAGGDGLLRVFKCELNV